MDPRKRKNLEQLLRSHKKRKANGIEALNILNVDDLCRHCIENQSDLCKQLVSLDTETKDLKDVVDKYDLADRYSSQYASISSYNRIVKELPLQIASKTDSEFSTRKRHRTSEHSAQDLKNIKKMIKHMSRKAGFLLNANFFKCFIKRNIWDCNQKTLRISEDNINLAKTQIEKFIKICQLRPPNYKISTSEEYRTYKCVAELLNLCCKINLKDTETVLKDTEFVLKDETTHLLKILFKMYPENLEVILNIQQPRYSIKLFDYIMNHAKKHKFNIPSYLSEFPNTIWEYTKKFSVIEAIVSGNKKRVLALMNHGFEVFPSCERNKSGHGFPKISEVMPVAHKMILEIMEKIKLQSSNLPTYKLIISPSQRECFEIAWSDVPDFYVTKEDLYVSINKEKEHLYKNGATKKECFYRLFRNRCLAKMYKYNFKKVASSSAKPEKVFLHFLYAPYKNDAGSKVSSIFRL